MRRVQMLRLIPLLPLLGLTACAGGAHISTAQPVGCSSLVDAWMKPVAPADIMTGALTVADLTIFGDEQTGKLDMANDRIVNGLATIKRCEDRDAAAVKRATKHGLF